MEIIISDNDYIKAVTPFLNGCTFRVFVITKDNKVFIEPGCYCLKNLLHGAEYEIYKMWKQNNELPLEIFVSDETRLKLLKMENCRCGSLIYVPT